MPRPGRLVADWRAEAEAEPSPAHPPRAQPSQSGCREPDSAGSAGRVDRDRFHKRRCRPPAPLSRQEQSRASPSPAALRWQLRSAERFDRRGRNRPLHDRCDRTRRSSEQARAFGNSRRLAAQRPDRRSPARQRSISTGLAPGPEPLARDCPDRSLRSDR